MNETVMEPPFLVANQQVQANGRDLLLGPVERRQIAITFRVELCRYRYGKALDPDDIQFVARASAAAVASSGNTTANSKRRIALFKWVINKGMSIASCPQLSATIGCGTKKSRPGLSDFPH
jgi:hypothetical protein